MVVVVKLGGSVLTNKGTRGRPRFNRTVASRLARELSRVVKREPVVLVHGAGSFAHPLAVQYGIGKRRLTGRRLEDALVRTSNAVRELRTHVLEACERARLPVVDVPAGVVASSDGSRVRFDSSVFRRALDAGLVPVTGGDVLLDERLGARVLSGDEIARILAKDLGARRVVFVSDVDGIRVDGRVVRELSVAEARAVLPRLEVGKDATGGIRGKVAQSVEIAADGVPVIVVNGGSPGRVEAAALGRRVLGTRIGSRASA